MKTKMHNVHPGVRHPSRSRLARIASWLEPPSYTTKECDHCYVAGAADSRTRGASTVSRMAQKIACNELLPYRCNIHVSQCTEAVRSLWVAWCHCETTIKLRTNIFSNPTKDIDTEHADIKQPNHFCIFANNAHFDCLVI